MPAILADIKGDFLRAIDRGKPVAFCAQPPTGVRHQRGADGGSHRPRFEAWPGKIANFTVLDAYITMCCTSCSQFASQAVLKASFHLWEGFLLHDTMSEPLSSRIEISDFTKAV